MKKLRYITDFFKSNGKYILFLLPIISFISILPFSLQILIPDIYAVLPVIFPLASNSSLHSFESPTDTQYPTESSIKSASDVTPDVILPKNPIILGSFGIVDK